MWGSSTAMSSNVTGLFDSKSSVEDASITQERYQVAVCCRLRRSRVFPSYAEVSFDYSALKLGNFS